MVPNLLALILTQTAPKLTVVGDIATLVKDGKTSQFRMTAKPTPPVTKLTFRKDDAYVVWDARGLTIRQGKRVYNSQLAEMSLSPKLFEREEILITKDRIATGSRKRDASGLSGAKRVGNVVYLLPRWTDREGNTWLECLVRIELLKPNAKPELLGKYDATSLAALNIDDQLFNWNGQLAVIGRSDQTWGLGQFDIAKNEFRYEELGTGLLDFRIPKLGRLLVREKTSYDTTVIARVDLKTLSRRLLSDSAGRVSLVDSEEPALAIVERGPAKSLHNLESAVMAGIFADEKVYRAFDCILLIGKTNARLLTLNRFEQICSTKVESKPKKLADPSAATRTRRGPRAPLANHQGR